MSEPSCVAVILAAGASSRLGQAKQLVKIDGEPLLERTVRLAAQVGCQPIIVVLGFEVDVSLRGQQRWSRNHSPGCGS